MYFFILLNLLIVYLIESESAWLAVFLSAPVIYVGAFCAAVAVILAALGKLSHRYWYDLFASGTVLVWLPFWYPDFRQGSPVFFYFPLYFALISALFSLVFIKRREQIDRQTLEFLQWLSDSGRFNPAIIVLLVLAGLWMKQHFLLYPVGLTLLVMRYALACSLRD